MNRDFTETSRCSFFAVLLRLLLLIAVLACPAFAAEQPGKAAQEFRKLQAAYQALNSRDPKAADLPAWEKTASSFIAFVRKYDDPDYTPRALLTLGALYETTYRKQQFRSGLTRAMYFYEELSRGYAAHQLADDALIRLGDLRRKELHDEEAARATYYEIVDGYPKGDQYHEALSRLGLHTKQQKQAPPAGQSGKREPQQRVEGGDMPEEVAPAAAPTPPASVAAATPAPEPEVNVEDGGKEIFSASNELKRPVIVIDPGHGGKEEGAHGLDGLLEKQLVLNISQTLDKLLRERMRAKTVLTRTSDVDISLQERTSVANEHGADLFVSVHANASEYKTLSGIETYYLDNTDDKSSLKLAQRENAPAMQQGGGDLSFIVSDLIQGAKTPDSVALAHYIQDSLHRTLSRYYKDVKNLGVKKAPFYVLVGAHMPCVLVEVSFIDHPVEGKRLLTRRYQKLVASAMYEGIRAFFESR